MTARLVPLAIFLALLGPAEDGFAPLFDGESLAGWTSIGGRAGNWRAEEGRLILRGQGKDWLSTNRAFGDFVLRLEYRIGPGGNSGVLIRAPHQGDPSFDGLEIQILDDDAPEYRSLRPDQYSGSVYGVVAASRGHVSAPGRWNSLEIRAQGSKVRVELNGFPVVDADLARHPEHLARHPGLSRRSGFLGLQSHESPAEFRNITIRKLHRPPGVPTDHPDRSP
ncbi:3-keto-disaccharide hydrolase [Tundrisphaera lichenicola]|uniref:3-keto-disaccharide hydrolase n=1 Tax=Tundrisphaera lichenicola TaxID=2029860 RepID=UPI003EBA4407